MKKLLCLLLLCGLAAVPVLADVKILGDEPILYKASKNTDSSVAVQNNDTVGFNYPVCINSPWGIRCGDEPVSPCYSMTENCSYANIYSDYKKFMQKLGAESSMSAQPYYKSLQQLQTQSVVSVGLSYSYYEPLLGTSWCQLNDRYQAFCETVQMCVDQPSIKLCTGFAMDVPPEVGACPSCIITSAQKLKKSQVVSGKTVSVTDLLEKDYSTTVNCQGLTDDLCQKLKFCNKNPKVCFKLKSKLPNKGDVLVNPVEDPPQSFQ